jgi:hypothetical protein
MYGGQFEATLGALHPIFRRINQAYLVRLHNVYAGVGTAWLAMPTALSLL